jgi:uncharacterized membrane protein
VALLIAIHILAAVVWVGGMFFAYLVLRPAAGALESGARLQLWHRVFGRFFPWVWTSIILLLASGLGMIFLYFGGFASAGRYVHVMVGIGTIMVLVFLYLFFAPWHRFAGAVDSGHLLEAAKHLGQIRKMVAVNLALGLITIVVGASGRFW